MSVQMKIVKICNLIQFFCHYSSTKEFADCSIVATKGKYFKSPYAWTFPKHSPYLDIFNFFISELIEKGIVIERAWTQGDRMIGVKPKIGLGAH